MMRWQLLAGAGAAALLFGAGALVGHKMTASSWREDMAEAERAAHAAYAARTQELNDTAAALEKAKNEKKIVYRTITKRVEAYIDRPVYQLECLDDDGLRDVNAAFAGHADPGQPAAAMPGADASGGQDWR